MGKNFKMFKMINGEMVLTEVVDVMDDGMLVLSYPSVVIPVPPEHAGGQQNQVGFGKYLPFSDYSDEITLNPNAIAIHSKPNTQMQKAYEQWKTQMRAQDSGIVMAGSAPTPGNVDFNNLNT